MTTARLRIALLALIAAAVPARAQRMPAPNDTRHSMLREMALGALTSQPRISDATAGHQCVAIPQADLFDDIQAVHGDSLVSSRCTVAAYDTLRGVSPAWTAATYHRALVFTHDGVPRGSAARDTVTEDEIVVFAAPRPGERQPVWHERFESDRHAIWRSITPKLATPSPGATLLSATYCVNGTGGCAQEFLLLRGTTWLPVWQVWLEQLPPEYGGRIRHGFRIDPSTLRGDAGFYSDADGNCCPSAMLTLELALRSDSLVLLRQSVARDSTVRHGDGPARTPRGRRSR